MAQKKAGGEPTYRTLVASCPQAVRNPQTKEPVDKQVIYNVLREECYDITSEEKWKHQARLQKTALTEAAKQKRLAWATYLLGLAHDAGWWYRHGIWLDTCNSITPRTEAKAAEQALARKGKRGWVSDDAKGSSENLRGNEGVLKQNSFDAERMYWAPVLTRGKLHVLELPDGFPGETPDGAATLVARVPGALALRFPNGAKPKVVMCDRGRGFFSTTGPITHRYKAALEAADLRPFQGNNAARQPGNIGDVLLRETAVAWLRKLEARSIPAQPWKETRDEFYTRLRVCCAQVNAKYDVEGLCKGFPKRLADVKAKHGDRLRK